ncbi:protein FAR1-RELATED SEQUENCE 5-like [Carya illinoinensis]|uniref:protein FAR1-RELATED SEQUENCE 5-like n=1 Tax=Carya illinoinensis TaxID=32201 RepID=UPI001C720D33|nr:protein FAR1-RELATED SEQUENCE 5-like [Carya illinoinensis]
MGNEKEQPTTCPSSSSNPPSENSGYGFQGIMEPPTPINNTSSATSKIVGSELDNRADGGESEAPCRSPIVERRTEERPNHTESNSGSPLKSQNVEVVDDDTIEEPKSGMEFNSLEELLCYYKEYGKKCEFGVMTKWIDRGEDESVRYVTLCCARGGKARNRTLNVAKPRATGKTECKAMINALKQDGVLRLTTVHNIHNHDLSLKKSRFFRCNREVSDAVKRVLDTNDLAGIRASKSYGSLVVGAGRFENLPFLEKDCRNYIDKARHLRLGAGGAGALRQYFLRMQYKNPGFFYMMDIDDDGRLKNVFWSDPRSRAVYIYFGDVVTFDTTYLTNRYGMPFAPFVGVNHHGQSILLGAGLISSEDTETFVWLFETWLQCMDGIAPKAIITDQNRAMKNAIALVFPNSQHRFYLWHILKKVSEKLGSYGSYKTGMKSALMKCVYDTQRVDEFEKCWDELITTYNLHENAWLQSLYVECEHWRFQELYTIAKFKEIQQQVNGIIDLNPKLHKSDGAVKTYIVEDEVALEEFTKLVRHFVDFSEDDAVAKCSCGLFEMRGILCRHILATITHAAGSRKHTEDARSKLYAMIELYRANEEPPSFTQIGSNVDPSANDTTVGCSGEVHSPRIVRGKGRPPSLRRASRMEIDMRKAKAKTKKAPVKGNRKERDGGDTRVVEKGDTPVAEVCRSLFGTSEIDLSNVGDMQQAIPGVGIDITGTQSREIVMQSQESIFGRPAGIMVLSNSNLAYNR